MRIDKINILGPFLIKGLTGGDGQVFGVSGSMVTWLTPSANGVQGPNGPTGFGNASIPFGQIVFGCGSGGGGMTSSSNLIFENQKFKHGESIVDNSVGIGTIMGSRNPKIYSSFQNSTILGGDNNTFYNSQQSSILGGKSNSLCNSTRSVISGGKSSTIIGAYNSVILGGINNKMPPPYYAGQICESSILGGKNNHIASVCNSSILSGESNCVYFSNKSTIIGGKCNKIDNSNTIPNNSVIIGGSCNRLSANCSAILASCRFGCGDTLIKNNSVVIGSSNLYISSYCENYSFMSNLYIYNTLCMSPTNNVPYYCTFFYASGSGLFFNLEKLWGIVLV
jgi:hypothetical protein